MINEIEKIRYVKVKEIKTITCDICGKIYDDVFEMQEFHHINFEGGYLSIFGDSTAVDCDICQHCLKEVLGKYLRIS